MSEPAKAPSSNAVAGARRPHHPALPPARLREEGENSSCHDEEARTRNPRQYPIALNINKKFADKRLTSVKTVPGRRNNSIVLLGGRDKQVPLNYRKAFNSKQAPVVQSLQWKKSPTNDNLVISFSDDDSESDSGTSQLQGAAGKSNSGIIKKTDTQRMNLTSLTPVTKPQAKMAEDDPQFGLPKTSKVVTNRPTVSSTSSGGDSHGQRVHSSKAYFGQTNENDDVVNLANTKLQNLRDEIALREYELKLQKRSNALGGDRNVTSSTDQFNKQPEKPIVQVADHNLAPTSNVDQFVANGRATKRLKCDQQLICIASRDCRSEETLHLNDAAKMNIQPMETSSTVEDRLTITHDSYQNEKSHVAVDNRQIAKIKDVSSSEIQNSRTGGSGSEPVDNYRMTSKADVALTLQHVKEVVPARTHPNESMQLSKIAHNLEERSFIHKDELRTGEGSTTLQSLLEMEEMEDKELEEAEERRYRCQIEERKALKAYRKAQRALIEANQRCAMLSSRRELLSAKVQNFIAESKNVPPPSYKNPLASDDILPLLNYKPSSEYLMLENVATKSDYPLPDRAPIEESDRYEPEQDLPLQGGTRKDDPTVLGVKPNPMHAGQSNMSSDGGELDFLNSAVDSRSSIPSYIGKHVGHADKGPGLSSDDIAMESQLLEASLRSELEERFSGKSLRNTESASMECPGDKPTSNAQEITTVSSQATEPRNMDTKACQSHKGTMKPMEELPLLAAQTNEQLPLLATQTNEQAKCTSVVSVEECTQPKGDIMMPDLTGCSAASSDVHHKVTKPMELIPFMEDLILPSCSASNSLPSAVLQNTLKHIKRVVPGFSKRSCFLSHEDVFSLPWKIPGDNNKSNMAASGTSKIGYEATDYSINPFWPFCIYELRGKCNDEECHWQHIEYHSWRKLKPLTYNISGLNSSSLFQPSLPIPTYRAGLNLVKCDPNLLQSVLACSVWQYWQRGFCASFSIPMSVQRYLKSQAPSLQAHSDPSADYVGSRHLLSFPIPNSKMEKIVHGFSEPEQFLELALDIYIGKMTKPNRIKALTVLARAIERDPNSVALWIIYLHVLYQKDEGLGEDDMFYHAVQYNVYSYELWLMYINSRLRYDDRMDAYNDALYMLCDATAPPNDHTDSRDKSAFVLDLFLQMVNCLSMSGDIERAFSKIFGIIPTETSQSNDKLLTDAVSRLQISDRCIFWVCCAYLLIYGKLPDEIVEQFELRKELPFGIKWPAVEATKASRVQILSLLQYAVDSMPSYDNADSSVLQPLQFLTISHINCVAVMEGSKSASTLLVKYKARYPTCVEIILMSTRLEDDVISCSLECRLNEILLNWPREEPGVQCLWNQCAELALAANRLDLAEKLLDRWFAVYRTAGEDDGDKKTGGSSDKFVTDSSDHVFWLLNLSLYHVLHDSLPEAQRAIEKALKIASGSFFGSHYGHCLRELADLRLLIRSSSAGNWCESVMGLLGDCLTDTRALLERDMLSRLYLQRIKKSRVKQSIETVLGSTSVDCSHVNAILEACFGPGLLPEKPELKEFVDFVESVMAISAANFRFSLSVCRFTAKWFTDGDVRSEGMRLWACSILVNSVFQAVPVAAESVWLEAAQLVGMLRTVELSRRFLQQAVSVFPFSIKLWQMYLVTCKRGGDVRSVVEAARQRGLDLVATCDAL